MLMQKFILYSLLLLLTACSPPPAPPTVWWLPLAEDVSEIVVPDVKLTRAAAELRDADLTAAAAVILTVDFTELPPQTEIALERFLQSGGGLVIVAPPLTDTRVSRARADRLRGILQTDYAGEAPADLPAELTLSSFIRATSLYLQRTKQTEYAADFASGKIIYTVAENPDYADLVAAVHSPQRDYRKATSAYIPPENRFVKEVFINNLYEPMKIDLLPDGRLIFIERHGEVTIFNPDTELVKPAGTFEVYDNYEDGLIGLAVDPNFAENGWIYFDYSPVGEEEVNRISRFTLTDDLIDFSSEKILLDIPTDRGTCCHAAGDMAFDAAGNLYITMGDDTNPWVNQGMAPIDGRRGQKYGDARRSSGNTNDLRGKILRIKPLPDGTYEIPDGNLFPPGTPDTRPEIYVMGVRNPFTISIDQKNNWLFWGDVGPDAGEADSLRGPRAYDEINLARRAGNFGWPFTRANRRPYRDYDFATEKSGDWFDPDNLKNTSPHNTGLTDLPPVRSSLIWYPYALSEEFPWTASGGKNPMAGPVYYSENYDGKYRFPDFFDGKLFVFEWMRHWIYTVELDSTGNFRRAVPFMRNTEFSRPMDMIFGKDGSLYLLEYGSGWFARNEKAQLSRIRYVRSNRQPVARIETDKINGAAPLTVTFSAEKSTDPDGEKLSFVWSFPGYPDQKGETTTFTYKYPGEYTAELRVTDASGHSDLRKVNIQVGNEKPLIDLTVAGNSQFYWENQTVDYRVRVSDREDGTTANEIAAERVSILLDLLPQGEDLALTEAGHQQADALAGFSRGELLMKKSDCASCHASDKKINGPSYNDIAIRYPDDAPTVNRLSAKIIKGGNGVWGETNMSAHPQLTSEQAAAMVKWILSLDAEKAAQNRLPLVGKFTPAEQPRHPDGYKMPGTYVLSVSYTDNGAGRMQPITARKNITFSAPLLNAKDADFVSFGPVELQDNWLPKLPVNERFVFQNIDLTDVGALSVQYRGRKGDGVRTYRLSVSTNAEQLAEVELITDDNEILTAEIPLLPTQGLQDLIFRLMSAQNAPAVDFGFIGLEKIDF